MGKHKHILFIIFIFSLLVAGVSCSKKVSGLQAFPTMEQQGFLKASVIHYPVDGCSWMIKLSDKKKLQPVNLQAEFQKDNLSVWIKYVPQKGGMSICMAGEMVTITEIKLRE